MGTREDGTGGFRRTEVMEVRDKDGNYQRWYTLVRPERSYKVAEPVFECGQMRGPLNHSVNRSAVEYTGCGPSKLCAPPPPIVRMEDFKPGQDYDTKYDREVHMPARTPRGITDDTVHRNRLVLSTNY